MKKIMSYYLGIISGKRRGLFSFFIRIIFFISSIIYGFFIEIRNIFYSIGIFRINKLSVPVISVGNITLGGTGKTPLVIWLAEWLKSENCKVGILTRGYGRKDKNFTVVLSQDNKVLDYNITGDEPLLIRSHVEGDIPIIVGSNRAKTGFLLEKKFHSEIVILDDGFQHISLGRNLDIVVIDALNPFGNYWVFPAGILREKIENLKRADAFIITKVDLISVAEKDKIIDIIKRIAPFAIILESIFLLDKFTSLQTGKEYPMGYVSQKTCIAFSGIGNPDGFLKTLKNNNISVRDYIIFPDHYPFQEKDIYEIFRQKKEKNSDLILTTEKDGIRLKNLYSQKEWEEDILFLSIKLQVIVGEEIIKERIRKLLG